MSGTVYLIAAGDFVKIGWAKSDVEKRLAQLQTGSPVQLELLATFPGSVTDEQWVQRHFSDLRVRGEWFERSDGIEAFFANPTVPKTHLIEGMVRFIEAHGSQSIAADKLGLSQGTVSRIASGKRVLSLSEALRIEAKHGINAETLVSDDDAALLRNRPALASLLSSPSQTDGAAA